MGQYGHPITTGFPIESNIFDFLNKYDLDSSEKSSSGFKVRECTGTAISWPFRMNRAVQYPFFPVVDTFNSKDSVAGIIVNKLEQILPLFPSEIKIDTVRSENVLNVSTSLLRRTIVVNVFKFYAKSRSTTESILAIIRTKRKGIICPLLC